MDSSPRPLSLPTLNAVLQRNRVVPLHKFSNWRRLVSDGFFFLSCQKGIHVNLTNEVDPCCQLSGNLSWPSVGAEYRWENQSCGAGAQFNLDTQRSTSLIFYCYYAIILLYYIIIRWYYYSIMLVRCCQKAQRLKRLESSGEGNVALRC